MTTERSIEPGPRMVEPGATTYRFDLWSTTGSVVVTDPAALPAAVEVVRAGLDEVELACSRFRPDSEISGLSTGRNRLSPMLADLVGTALDAAEASGGLVDPTVGSVVRELGYDRSIELLPADGAAVRVEQQVPGWRRVQLYGDRLELPGGLLLDLGATAKARAADLTARRVADLIGVGVLVELGGDIATAGPGPDAGWQVLVADSPDDPACQVTLQPGWALATSSTVRRAWRRGGVRLHHIVDPRTAAPAAPVWRSASVAAPTCVEANTASTAAVVLGHEATRWLGDRGFTARLVDQRHRVCRVGGWPQEVAA
ncbi:FAD:protein FMN transferase [Nocardioides cynanchi]|uniref:FAD:protein FMN transferase n=1 Tax=Nocardioides cynanchi TaxID=2558918 RepID=UPI00192D3A7E|nr:FAD:protein FMN transferase [Nocardioides cynanchi]